MGGYVFQEKLQISGRQYHHKHSRLSTHQDSGNAGKISI